MSIEDEQADIDTEIEFVYFKVNTFSENVVNEAILPEVEDRLGDIRKLQDALVLKWLKHKAKNKTHPGINDLEKKITDLCESVTSNNKKVREKVSSLVCTHNLPADTRDEVKTIQSESLTKNSSVECETKKSEFFDQIQFLSTSSGLDLANPESELPKEDLVASLEKESNAHISKLMRESKNWSKSLSDLSRIFRTYERASKDCNEGTEEFESNQAVFDTAKERLIALKEVIIDEDERRNLFTLDNVKHEKVKFPTFSGDRKEDVLKFKTKLTEAFNKNRVVLSDQLDKLRENLKGDAAKHVPDTIKDIEKAWSNLMDAYGDPLRILKERIKALDTMKTLPPAKKKEARVNWFLELESVLEDVISLGGDGLSNNYCTAFSEFTLEKILNNFPDEGEDVFLRKKLSATEGEGKERFENIKEKITKYRQDSQTYIGSSSKSKSREVVHIKDPSSQVSSQVSRADDCRICQLVASNTGFNSDVILFEAHFGQYPTHCPVFVSFSPAKRRAAAVKAGFCSQCLDPKIIFIKDHLSHCPVAKKDQFYTCKTSGCKSHLWLCTKHKGTSNNKKALEQESARLKSKQGLDMANIVINNSNTTHGCQQVQSSISEAVKTLEQAASDSGKELLPSPEGNPLFLFFGAKGRNRCLNTFIDSGSSGVLMKTGVPGVELPGQVIRKGPIILHGVGGLTAVADDEWLTAMETKDGKLQTMQVITMKQVTTDFPRINIQEAVNEIKRDRPSNKKLQNLRLPKEVGGWDTDVLIGIEHQSLFPKEIHSLPCGLTIFESKLLSHDGRSNAMVGGPHSTFKALAQEVGGYSQVLSMFVQGLASWRSFGPISLTKFEISYNEEVAASMRNIKDEGSNYIGEVVSCEELETCVTCGESFTVNLEDPYDKLSVLKKMVEIQEPLEVDYRCIKCRDCAKCRDADRSEKISLREEAEMFQIKQSIFLDYDKKRIDCSLPLRGPEREFLSTNRNQAIAILNKQCEKYHNNKQVKDSINKAFQKLIDRKFIKYLSDLTEEEKEKFVNKEVQYTIPWRVVWKDSATTPVRPVLDASTNSPRRMDGTGGSSLNNAICHGKVDTLDLIKVILKFVLLKHAVAADLTKMYNMFNLLPNFWNLQRIVLKEDLDPNGEVIDAVITTLIYGVSSVSCQTEVTCVKIADNCRESKPEAAACIEGGRYVDNILDSFSSKEAAKSVTADVDAVFGDLGLATRGWSYSGEPPVEEESLDGISLDLMGLRWIPLTDSFQIKIPRLHFGKRRRGRLDPETKFFDGDFGEMDKFIPSNLSRRQVVSKRASVHDMFGKIEPVKAKLKLFERRVFGATENWDDPLPEELRSEAVKNFILLEKLRGVHYYRPRIPSDAINEEARLILLVDAAEEVLMATVFIGSERKDGSWSCEHLIGRSALCNMSIPRNEIQSMLVGSNLSWVVRKALSGYVKEQITCGDSEIVLHWILSDHRRLDLWHRNRVVQVRRSLNLDDLYHVSSKNNPGDIGTRPNDITEADVGPESRYEKGDYWMTLNIEKAVDEGYITPASQLKLSTDKIDDFKKGLLLEPSTPEVIVKGHAAVRRDLIAERAKFTSYDPDLIPTKRKWPVMLRVTTLVISFCSKILNRLGKTFQGKLLSPCSVKLYLTAVSPCSVKLYLTAVEEASIETLSLVAQEPNHTSGQLGMLQDNPGYCDANVSLALQYYFRLATLEVKQFNSKSMLDRIAVEQDGILLSRTRINDVLNFVETGDLEISDLGSLNIRSKVPIIDRYSPLSYSIARHIHDSEHRGVETCFRKSLEQVQIIQGFSLFKELDFGCVKCKKKRGKFSEVIMGPVAENQVTIAPAFYCCQLDLWGPIKVFCPGFERDTWNSKAKETKNWILVGACPTTKAINLQVVDKSDARGILEALIRLGCEATWPKLFYCDDDSAIVKIMLELEVNLKDIQYKLYTEYGAKFEICAVGGHEKQGLVERRIQTVQNSFKELGLENMRVHSMGLQTMCKIVENALNNMPYGYTQSRSDSNQSLFRLISPNLLRHGRNNNRAISGPVKISADNGKILKEVEKRTKAWFKIFKDSCVPRLVIQKKWFRNERDLAVGDVVFYRKTESELGDGDWVLGMVEQVIPSKDGMIRKVVIKYRNAAENFNRFTTRNTRKVIKLFHVDDEDLSDDFKWVQSKVNDHHKQVFEFVTDTAMMMDANESTVQCQSCCCPTHCKVRFHNISGKTMANTVVPDMKLDLINVISEEMGEPSPDIEATISNLFEENKLFLDEVLSNTALIL